ncbi:hypothetical protein POX_e06470 [Penicillium oxalicum]|uniref:Uncharacterized protein n=1 Tax=Penicillium oxalicum (strain 114-2 / CGMCC 5302) TaxID=933388 RepID=S7ZFR9_PENO1|nr:hypothetical protein POX_e06470 [Penicillium oxalicum]EPS27506.1 hypothetical protein PDE_02449 [Penicillium oxalicum 114-2]KAI2788454.1 hypothetical protein POX_e06470 [Penicillium oxalicum]
MEIVRERASDNLRENHNQFVVCLRINPLLFQHTGIGEVGIKFKSRLWAEKGFVTNVRSRGPTNHHP